MTRQFLEYIPPAFPDYIPSERLHALVRAIPAQGDLRLRGYYWAGDLFVLHNQLYGFVAPVSVDGQWMASWFPTAKIGVYPTRGDAQAAMETAEIGREGFYLPPRTHYK